MFWSRSGLRLGRSDDRRAGGTQTVTWSSTNQSSYQLDLYKSSGQFDRTVRSRTNSTAQSHTWTVPTILAAGNYFIKVTIWNESGQSVSRNSDSFTIPNRSPILDTSGNPRLTAINEDATTNTGTLVTAIINSVAPLDMITDPDPGALEGLAIIGV